MGSQRWFRRYQRTHEKMHSAGRTAVLRAWGRPVLERLESRVLLSADPGGTALLPAFQSLGQGAAPRQVVFVDSAVPDSEVLVSTLSRSGEFEGQVIYLDGNRNGVAQITEALADYQELGAIHIFSHGAGGSLLLGNALLDARTIQDYAEQLSAWGAALAEEGDILLYGCDVADDAAGVSFLDDLRTLTGADIAASDDLTGSTALQGDWDLEFRRGVVETVPAFSTSRPDDYAHVLWSTVVALPDTQSYAAQQLQGVYDQTQWIADHADSKNIALVSQLGDLVMDGALYESQWVWVDGAMDTLDGTSIPYSAVPGNHDFDVRDSHTTINRFLGLDAGGNVDPALADKSFGPSRYAGESWFVGASADAHNYAQLFTADGQEYLHIGLEWLPRAGAVAWAQQQIDAHPELPVILSTHHYLDEVLGDHAAASGLDAYSGEQLFQALVYPNPQVFMVLSAHRTEYHQVSLDAAGFEVLEMMACYSTRPNGGNGWMQLVTLDPDLNRVDVQTYSPSLDQFEVDAGSQFSFDFDFQERFNFHRAPMAALANPVDQSPDDLNPAYDAVTVNTVQPYFQIQLTDANDGVDDATVTSQTVALTKDGVTLTESVDYSFSYDPATDLISLTPAPGSFGNGLYEIVLNGGEVQIADVGGNPLVATTLAVRIDTSIALPQTVTFQEGVSGYTGTLDTNVRGNNPDTQYSTATSVLVDGADTTHLPIEALLRFGNIFGSGPGQIPAGSQIASARLELNITDAGSALSFYRMLRNWVETDTWNTLGAGIQTDDMEAVDTPDATTDFVAAPGVLSIDVTASLRAWASNPATNFGWAILQSGGSNMVQFSSSEGTTPPKLIITFTAPPASEPPTVALANTTTTLPEDTSTVVRLKVADIVITDDGVGVNELSLSGPDVALFEIVGSALYLKAGAVLDYETNPVLDVTVAVDDAMVGGTPDSTAALAIALTDVNEPPTVTLANTTTSLPGNTSTTLPLKVADIVVTDDALGVNTLSLSGADATLFEIVGSELYLKAGTVLDWQANPVLDVTVEVDDATVGGAPDSTAALAIAVTKPNEAPTDMALSNAGVAENQPAGTVVGVLSTTDPDSGDTFTYSLVSGTGGTDNGAFAISGAQLRTAASFNYEAKNSYSIRARSTDQGGLFTEKVFTITVTDVNEAPTAALASPMDQGPSDLNPAAGAVTVNTTQPHFQIQLTDVDDGVNDATVTSQTVALTKDGVLLTESVDYSFSYDPATDLITLTPAGGGFGNGLYSITLNGGTAKIADVGGNALVTTTLAVRIDTSIVLPQTVTFQEGVNGYTGTLDTDVWGDFPDNQYSTSLSVRVDGYGAPLPIEALLRFENIFGSGPGQIPVGSQIASAHLELNVTDIGNALMFYRMLRNWAETETWNTLGAGIQTDGVEAASTPDVSTAYVAALGILSIDVTASLRAWVNAPTTNFGWAILQGSGTNRVQFDSSEGTTRPKLVVTFTAPGANQPPTVALANTTTSLPENTSTTPRLKVADIVITDDGVGVNNLSLTGADAALFEIDSAALYLKAGTVLDYETNPVLDVTVAVDDPAVGGTPDSTAALAIGVTDVNEPPTVTLINTITSLAENTSTMTRLKVADIVVTDDGVGVNNLSLTGADAALFEIEGAALYLKAGTILDYETNPVLDVTVAVDDATVGGTPDSAAALAIMVTFTNAAPTVALANATTSLAENTSTTPRLKVADIVITDDGVGVNNLSLSGADAALFEIEGAVLYLKTGTVLDYETNPMLDVTVAVDDPMVGGTPDGTATLAIAVTDVNEAPTVALANTTTSLPENTSTTPRLKVADIVVTDDALGVNDLSLSGADAALFEIEGAALYLKAGTVLDYETNPVLDVTVAVDDAAVGATPDSTAALAIVVTLGNQSPLDIALSGVSVAENQPVHTVVGAFSTTDPDAGNTFTYSLVSGMGDTDNGAFTVVGNQLKTAVAFNYEVRNSYSIRVRSTDQGGLYTEKGFSIAITDVNEAPTVALANTTTSLPENTSTASRLKVADIVVTDDALGVNALSLSGADAALFEIVGSELYLKAGTVLDYETNPVLDVTVAVDDATVGGTPDGTAALAVSVTFVGVPEITVLGNGASITDGDTTPSLADHTDFGNATQGGTALSRTFTVRNDGTALLTLGTVTVPAGFTLTKGLSGSLAAGASDTFTVQLDTVTIGTKTGGISFATNDSDENPFNFQITGTVIEATVNLALGKTAVASTSYSGYPASNATDGNASSRWSSQFSDNEWIYVDLGSIYTIGRVVLRWEVAYGRSYKLQVSNDASTWSDVYSTITGDGGVDNVTLSSPASGRYVRMLGTQRATMYGYSLYEMEIYGGAPVNHAPVVSSFSKSGTRDLPLAFAAAEFAGAFADPDAGDSLQKVKIASLPGHGVLTLGSTPATVNQEVPVAQIGTLRYTPNSGYTGSDSFLWNGSDGSLYAVNAAAVNLSIKATTANLAFGRPAVASTTYSGYLASNVTDGNANSRWSSQFSDDQWIYVDLGSVYTINRVVLRWETAYARSYKLQVSNDATTWSDAYRTTTGDGGVDDITLSSPASGRYVRMLGIQRATPWGYSLFELEVYSTANLALGKTAVASTTYDGFLAANVTDGNMGSRWSSQFSDDQWIYVDLGSIQTINRVVLRWEVAYGRSYKLQVSNDATTWSDVYRTTTGDGGVDDLTLAAPASGRYVRMLGIQRGTTYGYSLWEFEVYA